MFGHEASRVSVADIGNWRNGGKKQSACLLCWFSTKGKTGIWITIQGSFCRSRYITVLLLGHEESRVSVADIENWQSGGKKWLACLLCWFSTKGKTGGWITLQWFFCRSRYFGLILCYIRTWRFSIFSGWYSKNVEMAAKNGQHAFCVDSPIKVRLEDG